MSFTQEQNLFAGLDENGLNDLLKAFFGVRGHYLEYGTPFYVPPAPSPMTTPVSAIHFGPIVIDYDLRFSIPVVDIFPATTTIPPVGFGEFNVTTTLTVQSIINSFLALPTASLQVVGLCAPVVVNGTPGTGTIGLDLKQVEIASLTDPLKTWVETIVLWILKIALAGVQIPFNTLTIGVLGLELLVGPLATNNEIEVRGRAL